MPQLNYSGDRNGARECRYGLGIGVGMPEQDANQCSDACANQIAVQMEKKVSEVVAKVPAQWIICPRELQYGLHGG